jgi:hypothetical protein
MRGMLKKWWWCDEMFGVGGFAFLSKEGLPLAWMRGKALSCRGKGQERRPEGQTWMGVGGKINELIRNPRLYSSLSERLKQIIPVEGNAVVVKCETGYV